MSTSNRRQFIADLAMIGAASMLSQSLFAAKPSSIKIAYSAITWGGKDLNAMQDIASLGFKGIQLRANAYDNYKTKVQELKDLLSQHHLTLAMFSSGNVEVDPARISSNVDYHVAHASFVKALGGDALQLTNSLRKNNQAPTKDELKALAKVMNQIGEQTVDLGVQTTYHNHMHQWGETPEEVDILMQETNPKFVKMLLDVAHYHQGGGVPAKAVEQYKDRLFALHIKDVKSPLADKPNDPKAYKFVELGQGNVDLPAVFKALEKIKFNRWAVVELDGVPEPNRTPLESATISKTYLNDKLKQKI